MQEEWKFFLWDSKISEQLKIKYMSSVDDALYEMQKINAMG